MLTDGSICLPGIFTHLIQFTTLYVANLDICRVTMLGIYHNTSSPIYRIIIIVSHKLVEVRTYNRIIHCPVKPDQLRLILIYQFMSMCQEVQTDLIRIFLLFQSTAI